MGKKRKLLAVGRKRMLCVSDLGVGNIFGVSLCFSVIVDRTEHSLKSDLYASA